MRRLPLAVSHPDLVDSFDVEMNGCDASEAFEERLWWRCPVADDHVWDATVDKRASGQGCPFCSSRRAATSNCLATINPELAAQWHPTLNGDLTASEVLPRSVRKVWWQCSEAEDHVWDATVDKRTTGQGCPFCSGRRVTISNCLQTVDPELAAQWHPTLNGELTPYDVVLGSNTTVWWKCDEAHDHVWSTTVNARTGRSCPFCANRMACESNCMATTHPHLASQLHPTLNGDINAHNIVAGTHKKLWWFCDAAEDHIWETTGEHRLSGTGCPFCAGQRVAASNCLATVHPEIAAQWHPALNGELTPYDVHCRSTHKCWWQCDEAGDHVWRTTVEKRALGSGCPFCLGRSVAKSNCLATVDPELAAQWHPTLNGELTPADVVLKSNKKVWWNCDVADDHVWSTKVNARTGRSCPFCTNRLVCESNCMATTHPHLATQLHPTLNGDINAHNVVMGTGKKLWWRCPHFEDHAWQQTGDSRKRRQGGGCPYC